MNVHHALLLLQVLTATPASASGLQTMGLREPEVSSHFIDANASDSGELQRPVGLFPIWENTATVLRARRVYLGSSLAGIGLGDRLQLGTHPTHTVMSAPNVQVKALLVDGRTLRVAAHAEVLWLQEHASQAFWFSNFTSRLTTRAGDYWVVPVGLTASWAPVRGLFVTATGTVQGVASELLPEPQTTLGVSAQLEWRMFRHHALTLHAAEVGLGHHDFTQLGASYRYQRWIFDAALGCAVQVHPDGAVLLPIAAAGIQL